MSNRIEITAEAPKPIEITFVGVDYKVRPIKASLGIALAQNLQNLGEDPAKIDKGIAKLLNAIFGKDVAKDVKDRMTDPDDLLDIPHVMELLNKLMEKSSGNPTT